MNWATFWSAASAAFTLMTALTAVWAMFRWKKQDELKAKLNFKLSVSRYAACLATLPETLDTPHIRNSASAKCGELSAHLSACLTARLVLEHLLDEEEEVRQAWDFIFENNKNYFSGEMPKSKIGEKCMIILNHHFVFK